MADDQQMNEEEMEAEPLTIDEEAEALKIPFASIGVTASPGIWGPCGIFVTFNFLGIMSDDRRVVTAKCVGYRPLCGAVQRYALPALCKK